jgi:serine/threonine protein kinase
MLPTTQEYKIALMIGEDSFRTLQNLEVIPHPSYPNEPWYSTGGLAIVFKIKMKEKFYALKCFYVETNERQERLGHIATYLKQNPSLYFVDFTYLDNELWVETTQGGNGYPVVLMEWVEGKTLDNYLAEVCKIQDKARLQNLYFQFCNLAWWLQQQPIAHGDLKHDNILVTTDGNIKLIDYDGMFVPALSSRKASELGSPCYQHPKRDTHFFNKDLDDFSLLILQITLLALQHEPTLFAKHYNGDGILLKDTDYSNFAQSTIRALLWQFPDVKLPLLLSQLQSSLKQPKAIDLVPLLQDVEWINWLVGGQIDNKQVFERAKLKELILKDERWLDLFIKVLCLEHPLNHSLLQKFRARWDWRRLSFNSALLWSLDFIETYQDKWNWDGLSCNESLPWSIELLEKYDDKWDWAILSSNKSLPWSIELLEKYDDKWVWNKLSNNKSLPWSIELLEKYDDKWDWEGYGGLSFNKALPWSIKLLERYENKWNWKYLSSKEFIPWSIELLEKYKDRWDWGGLSWNKSLPWTRELIEQYQDRWDWGGLSWNTGLPWTMELIEQYQNKWYWGTWGLSSNTALPWSLELIEKYEANWDWGEDPLGALSNNEALPWSLELIEKYKDKWDWDSLNMNEGLPWSIKLFEKYIDKWTFGSLYINDGFPWSIELLEKYENKWNWKHLSSKESIPWSIELLEKYKNKWDWFELKSNASLYKKVFQPLLNDEFIDEIMAEI